MKIRNYLLIASTMASPTINAETICTEVRDSLKNYFNASKVDLILNQFLTTYINGNDPYTTFSHNSKIKYDNIGEDVKFDGEYSQSTKEVSYSNEKHYRKSYYYKGAYEQSHSVTVCADDSDLVFASQLSNNSAQRVPINYGGRYFGDFKNLGDFSFSFKIRYWDGEYPSQAVTFGEKQLPSVVNLNAVQFKPSKRAKPPRQQSTLSVLVTEVNDL
ncbi:hypothetical protein, partial [Marinagarivorans algicola]|uniref:hypothetical protein n=1 Tax=Marinagarivorans algicola TaxID=1513270 RepID=UPI0012E2E3C6